MSTNTQIYIWQSVIIDITIPDHFTIYCIRKIPKTKYSKRKEITFYSLKITQVMPINRVCKSADSYYDSLRNSDATYSGFF